MKAIELDDLRADPMRIRRALESGEGLFVGNHDRPVAEAHPTVPRRPFGLAAGKIQITDDFDSPLPAEILHGFGETDDRDIAR